MTWRVLELVGHFPPTFHTVPDDDLIEHEVADDCTCGPTQNPVQRSDGVVGWVVAHHALDGREAEEESRRLH